MSITNMSEPVVRWDFPPVLLGEFLAKWQADNPPIPFLRRETEEEQRERERMSKCAKTLNVPRTATTTLCRCVIGF